MMHRLGSFFCLPKQKRHGDEQRPDARCGTTLVEIADVQGHSELSGPLAPLPKARVAFGTGKDETIGPLLIGFAIPLWTLLLVGVLLLGGGR